MLGGFRNNTASANGDGMTHLGRALDRLDNDLICANSPQAKGRVERANATPQDRLVNAMRLHRIDTIHQANAFLPSYMAQHNQRFAKAPFDPRDLHRPLAIHENLDAEMVWREQRTATGGLTLHYNRAMFILEPSPVAQGLARKKVDLGEYPDGRPRSSTRVPPCPIACSTRCVGEPALSHTGQVSGKPIPSRNSSAIKQNEKFIIHRRAGRQTAIATAKPTRRRRLRAPASSQCHATITKLAYVPVRESYHRHFAARNHASCG